MADDVLYKVDIDIEAVRRKVAEVNASFQAIQKQAGQIEAIARKTTAAQSTSAAPGFRKQTQEITKDAQVLTVAINQVSTSFEKMAHIPFASSLDEAADPFDRLARRAQVAAEVTAAASRQIAQSIQQVQAPAARAGGSALFGGASSPFPPLATAQSGRVTPSATLTSPIATGPQGVIARSIEAINKLFRGTEETSARTFAATGSHVRQLGFALDRFGINGAASFGEIFAAAGVTGLAIGAILVPVIAITKALAALARAGAAAFKELIRSSVETARSFDIPRLQFRAIFEGDEDAAEAAFQRIRDKSRELGTDLTELGKTFLPRVESLEQFDKLAEVATALARADPLQGIAGASFALRELLAGDTISLKKRFEIFSGADIERIKQLQDELGPVQGAIQGIAEVLERSGLSAGILANTLDTQLGQSLETFRDFKDEIGSPIVDELIEQFQALNRILAENEDEINIVAHALGEAVADLVEFGGEFAAKFLQGLDTEQAIEFANALRQTALLLETIIKLLDTGAPGTAFSDVASAVESVNRNLERLAAWLTLVQSVGAAAAQVLINRFGLAGATILGAAGEAEKAAQLLSMVGQDPSEAFTTQWERGKELIQQYRAELETAAQETADFAGSQNESTAAGEAAANAMLAERQAAEELGAELADLKELANEASAARRKIKEQRIEFDIDKSRAAMDLEREQARDRIDLEIEISQKRQDLARQSAQAIQDIYRKHNQRLADALLDARRREYDILRKASQQEAELAQETAHEQEEIEEDFQRRLQDIKRRFDFDAQEAIRQNDAIQFLAIQRRKEFELESAREDREDSIQDAVQNAEERRAKIREQLQLELEDARLAGQRKLEDLQIQLQRELQENAIKQQREIEDLRIFEQRKRAEQALTFQRQREDFAIFWQRKLADLIRNYQQELAIIARYEREKLRIILESRAHLREGRDDPGTRNQRGGPRGPEGGAQERRQHGGTLIPNRKTLVGEGGPEIVEFDQPGRVTPLNKYLAAQAMALRMSPTAFSNTAMSSSRTIQNSLQVSLLDPNAMNLAQREFVQQFLLDLLYRFQGR